MSNRRKFLFLGTASVGAILVARGFDTPAPAQAAEVFEVSHTDAEWQKILTPAQYNILRQQGTETPFSSPLLNEHRAGVFNCAGCALPLYSSTTKYDSHTGWPSFYKPLANAVATSDDNSIGMDRTEVHCRRCGGHLGHVFPDGPPPTGLRYCMDGLALTFTPA
ncbi:MAG: peptide-methionine (R)-S-oxide reductase MsrB [Acidocella sp.]|nr:peptide-methionine (R)-S-oxide reductase MsrB [Acidocella sp.]